MCPSAANSGQEEQSLDAETWHQAESVAGLAFAEEALLMGEVFIA